TQTPDQGLRVVGLLSAALGLAMLWLVRGERRAGLIHRVASSPYLSRRAGGEEIGAPIIHSCATALRSALVGDEFTRGFDAHGWVSAPPSWFAYSFALSGVAGGRRRRHGGSCARSAVRPGSRAGQHRRCGRKGHKCRRQRVDIPERRESQQRDTAAVAAS